MKITLTMPGLLTAPSGARKRKRDEAQVNGVKSRKAPKTITGSDSTQADILLLEEQVLASREHYNNIVELQSILGNSDRKPKTATLAAVALCRVFCRLISGEKLVKKKGPCICSKFRSSLFRSDSKSSVIVFPSF